MVMVVVVAAIPWDPLELDRMMTSLSNHRGRAYAPVVPLQTLGWLVGCSIKINPLSTTHASQNEAFESVDVGRW